MERRNNSESGGIGQYTRRRRIRPLQLTLQFEVSSGAKSPQGQGHGQHGVRMAHEALAAHDEADRNRERHAIAHATNVVYTPERARHPYKKPTCLKISHKEGHET